MSPSTSTQSTSAVPTFASLGVRTLINCQGTYTIISGSRALTQVAEAMREATNHYVHMDDLMDKVGQRLAELTGAEWGYISAGCAAALAEVTAACIAGADPEKMARLPDTTGMRNEIIIQKGQRNSYDRAMRMAGAHMVEVVTRADLRCALSERTAMLAVVGDIEQPDHIPAQEMIAIAHAHGVPCLVDAAAQRPDVPNRYVQMGADAVCYSGGKALRGPQASGLVLGRKALLQAAFLNAAPHHGLGRAMKAGKEEIMGLLAAVEAWVLGRDHQAEWRMWEGFLEQIRAAIADLPSVRTEVRQPGVSNVAPTLFITWDVATLHSTPAQVHKALREGDPAIALHLLADGLLIMPYMMEEGDAAIVARRLREVLNAGPTSVSAATPAVAPAQVGGHWQIHTRYVLGESTHALNLQQVGNDLSGTYRSQYAWSDVKGRVEGNQVELRVVIGYQGNNVTYVFTGVVEDALMRGTVSLGEYGSAPWNAQKVG
jgi:D-glucosaminate-6-phosphate ammonia-lyase